VTTVDHKKIGIMYFVTAFLLHRRGLEALLIRCSWPARTAGPDRRRQYNQIFTMHGLTMVFFASCRCPRRSSTT
jgi:cytochrome c oxidase subunit I